MLDFLRLGVNNYYARSYFFLFYLGVNNSNVWGLYFVHLGVSNFLRLGVKFLTFGD